jgi:hypothetical protein
VTGTTEEKHEKTDRLSTFLLSANTILHTAGFLAQALYILNSFHRTPWFCCPRKDIKVVFTNLTAIPL